MSTTDLAAKAADQRKRDTAKRANEKYLRGLTEEEAARVRAAATDLAEKEARAGKPRRSAHFVLADVITVHQGAVAPAEDDTQECRTCHEDKPLAEFPKYRRGQCRECYNKQWRAWNAARKASS